MFKLPSTRPLRAALSLSLAAVALATGESASAQTNISGPLSDNTTGALNAGIYVATSNISVPAGQTLTIQPGVLIKFNLATSFTVNGRLLVNGTGPDSVVFTDVRDDSIGGDTNGDGNATSPAPAFWAGLRLSSGSDASVVSGLTLRYGGRFGEGVWLNNTAPTLIDCRTEDSSLEGFDLTLTATPTLTRCTSVRSAGTAFANVLIEAVPSFTGLAASDGAQDILQVRSSTVPLGEALSIQPGNLLDGVMVFPQTLTVPSSSSLTLQPGTIVKWGIATSCTVDGILRLQGTASTPVILTDLRDDSAGGDTNGDGGASVPAGAWWAGVQLRDTADSSVLEHAEIRYSGRFGSGINLISSTATITNCSVLDSGGAGLDFNTLSRPTINGLTVTGATADALREVSIQALAGLTGLSLTGNSFDRVNVSSTTIGAGELVAFGPENGCDGTFYFSNSIIVEPGGELEVAAGTIAKMEIARQVQVDGILRLNGTPGSPVRFTDVRDDSVGGDTNGNGSVNAPGPGFWAGFQFSDSADGSQLLHADILYAGRFGAAIRVFNATMTIERCRVMDCVGFGISLEESTEPCLLNQVQVDRSSGAAAIGRVRLDRVADIDRPSGEGNARNAIEVTEGTLGEDVTIETRNLWNDALLISGNASVPANTELTLGGNVVFKFNIAREFNVEGTLSIPGSFEQPVVMTDLRDDSVGGDTNGDAGASVPSAGFWTGLVFESTTNNSAVEGLEVRFAGRFGVAIESTTNRALLRQVRVASCGGDGFRLTDHPAPLERVVAVNCNGDGLELLGGSFDVRQATLMNCAGFGIRTLPAYAGGVRDSIVRGNSQGEGFGVSLTYSAVDAATGTGNIFVDPLFLDEAGGDLRLTAGSPCINAGDPASVLDPDSTRADMGAYFFNVCEPSIICVQQDSFPPCAPIIDYQGFASASRPEPFLITLDDAPTNSFAIFLYSLGTPMTINAMFGDLCVGGPYKRTPAVAGGGSPLNGPCDGLMQFDMNAFIQGGSDPTLVPGASLIGHFWYRYLSAPGNARFSDALQAVVCP